MRDGVVIRGADGEPVKMDPNFNIAMSEEARDALDEKCERVRQLEKDAEDIREQWKKEVEELKEMVRKLGEENIRLIKLLKEKESE